MRRSLFAIAAVAAMVGCRHEKPGSAVGIRIYPTIETRVTGLYFDEGDRIGLSVVRAAGNFVVNRPMTYDGSAFTAPGLLWYNDLNERSTLTAYYPYAETGVPTLFRIAADQTTGTESSDLLGAVKRDVTPVAAPVGMVFRHLMSQLTVTIDNKSDGTVTQVVLGGLVPAASVDFEAQTAVAATDVAAEGIRALEVETDRSYRAIVVPQTAALSVTIHTSDGKSRTQTIASALLESGRRYNLAVEVTNIDISLSLSGEITDWEDGGSLESGGNTGDDGPIASGELEYGGETYRSTAIDGTVWMAENLRYMPDGAELQNGMWYPSDGASAVAEKGLLYDYTTATGAETRAAKTSGVVRGICPSGWHIPQLAELEALIASENRPADFLCCSGFWIATSGRYGAANRGYLLCADAPVEGQCTALMYTATAAPQLVQVPSENGITVRCVRD